MIVRSADVAEEALAKPLVALVGAPNVGKSTLFNGLTGANLQMGNWPGTTVEVGRGVARLGDREVDLLDLPGAYSLDPSSPDEALTRDLLLAATGDERPDVAVVIVDANHLARSLYLVRQVRETDLRVVVAITMADVAERRGYDLSHDALAQVLGVPVVMIDPRRRLGRADLLEAVNRSLREPSPSPLPIPDSGDEFTDADIRFAWIDDVERACLHRVGERQATWSDTIDRFALHPVIGPLLFMALMWLVFQLTTAVARPSMDALDAFFAGPVSAGAAAMLQAFGLQDSWISGLVLDGLIAGVGMLLTFAPLMAIMFVLLALLEDSGYLARAAVVTDRLMRAIGLPGRAFLPIVVGFGCNVPAIAATRILPNARHRILTALLVPFTSCTARLVVYVMMATIFFPQAAGTVVFVLYIISIAFVIVIGLLLKSTLWRTMPSEPLVIDLPPYQRPTLALTASVAWIRLRGFLQTAGGIIVATVTVVWVLQAIPLGGGHAFGAVPIDESLYARTAQVVAPVFDPAGFGTWETTSALIVGFVAKEAVVSAWAQTYAAEEPEDTAKPGALGDAVKESFTASSSGHTNAAVWAFLVFLLAYTPCVATLAAQRREIGLRWTAFGVAQQLLVAWLVAVAIFQIGARL